MCQCNKYIKFNSGSAEYSVNHNLERPMKVFFYTMIVKLINLNVINNQTTVITSYKCICSAFILDSTVRSIFSRRV